MSAPPRPSSRVTRLLAVVLLVAVQPNELAGQAEVGDRDVRRLEASACYAQLDALNVRYARPETSGVAIPVRLRGPVSGIAIEFVLRRQPGNERKAVAAPSE